MVASPTDNDCQITNKTTYRRNASLRLKLAITVTTPAHWSGLNASPKSTTAKRIIMTGSDVLRSEARAAPIMLALTKKHR